MGFEVQYNFYSEIGKGEYNREDKQSGTIRVGSAYDEVSLEVLAGKVMAIMARRNILVTDVQIYELVKKPINFKETEDGITIKNKKFKFDDGPPIYGDQVEDTSGSQGRNTQETGSPQGNQFTNDGSQALGTYHNAQGSVNKGLTNLALVGPQHDSVSIPNAAVPLSVDQPSRFEFYFPESDVFVRQAKTMLPDLAFTEGRKYPVIKEVLRPVASRGGSPIEGAHYVTRDDRGRTVTVNANLFCPKLPSLIGDNEPDLTPGASKGLSDANLVWSGGGNNDMPDLRRGR